MDNPAEKANDVFLAHHKKVAWFGRCIFLSWYCDVGTCKFCYRSTQKNRIKYASNAKRSLASVLIETLLAKHLGWRIEFLTGGYKIYSADELENIIRLVSGIYGEKIWLNLGAISNEDLDRFRPYIKGVVASIETANPNLHKDICPDKPVKDYERMFAYADMQKSATIIIGLGETKKDFEPLAAFIEKHSLDRITFYALKPVKDTPYKRGPSTDDYVWWVANTRIRFPELQIITGTAYKRVTEESPETHKEVYNLMRAGSNAITKFPITKKFGSPAAEKMEQEILEADREMMGSLTKMPDVDWDEEIDSVDVDIKTRRHMKELIKLYLKKMC